MMNSDRGTMGFNLGRQMPVVFVSHGSPDILLSKSDAVECWKEIGRMVPHPKAILAVSAHWESSLPMVSQASAPSTVHDFGGFAPELYRMQYPAPGAPELAEHVASLLGNAGIPVRFDSDRGLDHGAWIPLYKMYPEASVPVAQLSIAASAGPEIHYAIGRALRALRDEGVLILGSGAITHNFGWIDWDAMEDAPPSRKAKVFSDWVAKQLADRDAQSLMKYKAVPYGLESHPSEDHFMPLFVTLGAAENEIPKRFQPRFAYGGLSMDAYYWDGATSAP